jgi:hypothetical protein
MKDCPIITLTDDKPAIWRDFDKLKAEALAGRGFFFYQSYGRPVIIKGKAVELLKKGRSLFIFRGRFIIPQSLGYKTIE